MGLGKVRVVVKVIVFRGDPSLPLLDASDSLSRHFWNARDTCY